MFIPYYILDSLAQTLTIYLIGPDDLFFSRDCVTSLEWANCSIAGQAFVKTSGAWYFKLFNCFLQAFEVLKSLIPNPFKFASSTVNVDSKFLNTFLIQDSTLKISVE